MSHYEGRQTNSRRKSNLYTVILPTESWLASDNKIIYCFLCYVRLMVTGLPVLIDRLYFTFFFDLRKSLMEYVIKNLKQNKICTYYAGNKKFFHFARPTGSRMYLREITKI